VHQVLEQMARLMADPVQGLADFVRRFARPGVSQAKPEDGQLALAPAHPGLATIWAVLAHRQRQEIFSRVAVTIASGWQPRVREFATVFPPLPNYYSADSRGVIQLGFEYRLPRSSERVLLVATIEPEDDRPEPPETEEPSYDEARVVKVSMKPLRTAGGKVVSRPVVTIAEGAPEPELTAVLLSLARELARDKPSARACARILNNEEELVGPPEDDFCMLEARLPVLDDSALIGFADESQPDWASSVTISPAPEKEVALSSCAAGFRECHRAELIDQLGDDEFLFEYDDPVSSNLVLLRVRMTSDPLAPDSVVEELCLSSHARSGPVELG
jgi:hypothetical protein